MINLDGYPNKYYLDIESSLSLIKPYFYRILGLLIILYECFKYIYMRIFFYEIRISFVFFYSEIVNTFHFLANMK